MARIDIAKAPTKTGSAYPEPFQHRHVGKTRVRLGDGGGLTQFGVNRLTLPPGMWSAERHWHTKEDEFVWIVSGEVVLVTDEGETVLKAGDCAAFPAGAPDGHHLQNRSAADAVLLEVGSRRSGDAVAYPDVDLDIPAGERGYRHKDGTPW